MWNRELALFFNYLRRRLVVGGQRHALATLTSGKIPGAHCIGVWVDPRVGRDTCVESRPYRDSIPGPSTSKGRRIFISRSRCPLSLFSCAALLWRWGNYDCSKRRELRTQRHGVTCRKIWMISNATVSNRKCRIESICWLGRGGGGDQQEMSDSWREERRNSCGNR